MMDIMDMNTLSHEIINPLNIIVGCAELSQIEADQINNDKIANYLKTIVSESMKCCSLLEQTIKETKTIISKYNIVNQIKTIVKSLENHPLLYNKKLVFNDLNESNESCASFEIAVENKSYLKIIINNMIMNAIKHSSCNSDNILVTIKTNKQSKLLFEIHNSIVSNAEECHIDKQHDYFTKSNFLGLNIIDSLVRKLNYEWNLLQDGNNVMTQLTVY